MNASIPFLARLRHRAGRVLRIIAAKILGSGLASPISSRPTKASAVPAHTNQPGQNLSFSFTSTSGGRLPTEMIVHRISLTANPIPTTRTTTEGNIGLPYNARSNAED
jgi:hypothetical protein